MATPNSQYWAARFTQLTESLLSKGEEYAASLEKEYEKAALAVQKEIEVFYQRFALNNSISLSEARKLLTSKELKEFKWSVEDYIKYGKQNALDQSWMKELENASLRYRISRLESLQLQMRQQVEALAASRSAGMKTLLGDTYSESYYRSIYEVQKGFGVGSTFAQLDQKAVDSVLSKPWSLDGRNFSEKIWGDRSTLFSQLQTKLSQSFARGDSPDRAIKDIQERFKVAKSASARLVMTESAYFANEGRAATYSELDVEQYEYLATLELHTCELCGEMDGRVFELSEKETGVNFPVLHPWCRCTTVPYFEDNETERFARDIDGKTYKVDGSTTYEQWRKDLNEKYSEETVNKTVKMQKNELTDKAVYKNYKSVLKAEAPKTFANFQDLKYNNTEQFKSLESTFEKKRQSDWQSKIIEENADIDGYRTFENISDIPQWARDQAINWTDAEKSALNYYSSHEFSSINRYLRGRQDAGAIVKAKIDDIASAIDKSDIAENIVVWRGTSLRNFTQGEWLQANPIDKWLNRVIADKAFSSTSMLKASAFGSLSVFMQILVPKGSRGAYISEVSEFEHEYEMLFQKGSIFEILYAEENDGKTFIKVLYRGVGEK